MIRKLLVALAWVAGGLAGLCVLLYLVAVAVNWRDADPSEAAQRMAEAFRSRPAVRDEDNAFVFVTGFDVARGESPLEMGRKRIEWLQASEGPAPLDRDANPFRDSSVNAADRDPDIRAYLEACIPGNQDCSIAFEKASHKFASWERSEGWLLERYQTLIGLSGWREHVAADVSAPIPAYKNVAMGQKFLLLYAKTLASNGDAAGVRKLLGDDLLFWRMVFDSSDLLISKMIATSALNRHFQLGAAVIQTLDPVQIPQALPAGWIAPISDSERSMRRCMNGEWIFMSGVIRHFNDRDLANEFGVDDSIRNKVVLALSAPLYQPQDTINLNTDHYVRVVDLLDGVPLADYEAATDQVAELSRTELRKSFPPRSPYNFLGRAMASVGAADFAPYARRVGDVEGVRRAALAAVRLSEARIAPDDMTAALDSSPLRNPYDDKPFDWDAASREIVFRGLQAGDRGVYRIR